MPSAATTSEAGSPFPANVVARRRNSSGAPPVARPLKVNEVEVVVTVASLLL